MDGYEFEDYISNLFRKLGFDVEATSYSNDGGIDLVATFNQPIFSGKYIIQCKNWIGPVGQPEVRDLYGVVMDQRANKGILITPSDYTQQAYDFAKGKNIELINGKILKRLTINKCNTFKSDEDNNTTSLFKIVMKDNNLSDRYYTSIMKSLSRAFQSAISHYKLDLSDFIKKFIQTDIFKNYDNDFTLYTQAPTYPIGKAIDELAKKGLSFDEMDANMLEVKDYYEEAAGWIGYILMYWKIKEGITSKELSTLNVEELIIAYETLHTRSLSSALDIIKNEYI